MLSPRVDLHTHTTASDGGLSPRELVLLAQTKGVNCLAVTDHDTCAGIDEAAATAREIGLAFVPGIELSSVWGNIGVHVVGLAVDPASIAIEAAVAYQLNARRMRSQMIDERLAKKGFPGVIETAEQIAGCSLLGRPHMARAMVALGYVDSENDAFKRYLGAGKIGDIRSHWPDIDQVIGWIRDAGGVAVLAHPGKYDLSWTKIRALLADFAECGGQALEVSYGNEHPQRVGELVKLANQFKLKGSVGSDFHRLEQTWTALGKYPGFKGDFDPVWTEWI